MFSFLAIPKFANVQDIVADPDAPIFRHSPLVGLLQDLFLVITRVIFVMHNVFLPFNPFSRKQVKDVTNIGIVFQIILTMWSLLVYVPLCLFGLVSGGIAPILLAYATSWPLLAIQGPRLITIPESDSSVSDFNRSRYKDESWVFINGICTSQSGVGLTVRRLETLFQRPVTGIHNRTLGPIYDLLECVLQRDVAYLSVDIRQGFMETKKRLQDESIKKVVLIGHSQGGIVVSLLVDQLINDLSTDQIEKLEVYTFANAGNHFSDPIVESNTLCPRIKYVEHYANEKDPVSQIGVLAYSKPNKIISSEKSPPVVSTCNRFTGRLFVRKGVSGHMLLGHYLDAENSVLDMPEAKMFSRLRQYMNGNVPNEE